LNIFKNAKKKDYLSPSNEKLHHNKLELFEVDY